MTGRTWHRNAALVVPLLLVNTAALYGQAGWAHDHLGHGWTVAVLFAAAVESIGVYLAAEAHAALMAGDASARLRLGSYAVGALVGVLNFAHFAGPGYRPNPLALTFGLLSSISPWLWAIRSRSLNRDRLRALGLIDPRAVRFSPLRWALFPVRTGRAFRAAVWAGVVQPAEAVGLADRDRAARRGGRAAISAAKSQATPAIGAAKPRARKGAPKAAKVAGIVAVRPDLSTTEAARLAGVSPRTARRVVNSARVDEMLAEVTS
jgi:hypothetical protein